MSKFYLFILVILFIGCSQSEKHIKPNSVNAMRIKKWYNKGIHQIQRDLSMTIKYADSIKILSKNESPEHKAMGEILKGYYYAKLSEDVPSLKSFSKAKKLLANSQADTLKITVLNGLGSNFLANGEYDKASEYLFNSLRIANRIENKKQIANINAGFGDIYLQKGEMKLAEKHLVKAITLLQNSKKSTTYLIASHNLANYMGMTGNIAKALEIDEEGLRICDEINSNNLKVTFLDNKANCFFYTGQIDSAEIYFRECLRLDKLNKNFQQESDSYINLAHVYAEKKDLKTAMRYIDTSLILAKKTNYRIGIIKAYKMLMDNFEIAKDYKALSETQKLYITTYKELTSAKKESSIARYQAIYELEEKEINLLKAKVNIGKKEKQIQSKNNMLQVFGLLILAIIILGYLIYNQLKLRNFQQEKEFELKTAIKEIESQNQLQNQRLQISRDLHDNIGAQLTFIISSVENLNYSFDITDPKISGQLNTINDFAQSTIVELRDTIWAMNSEQISNEDLKARIHNFLEKAQNVKSEIEFAFNISESLIDYSFTSLMGINVYRVLQESVNNAIKYSEAKKINVEILELNNRIEIRIVDNGIGFSINEVEYGNGIINMRKRMAEINGEFHLETKINSGTEITLICPKTIQHA